MTKADRLEGTRTPDGAPALADTKIAWPEEEYPFVRMSTSGVPLISVTDTGSLSSRIIEPLLKGLEEA